MINQDFFDRVTALAADTNFQNVSRITDRGEQTQRPLEMVMRFLVFLHFDYDGVLDVEEFVDDRVIKLAEAPPPSQALDDKFSRTFALLNAALGDQALQKWDDENQRFTGRVGQVALEVVAVGIARNLPYIETLSNQGQFLVERIQEFWQQPEAQQFTASGLRGTQRLRDTILFGQNWFAE